MKLSILICTVENRREQFANLANHLKNQIILLKCEDERIDISELIKQNFGSVYARGLCEFVWQRDNKEMSIGNKRQQLLESATGDYVVFIDDDDWVSDDYIKLALEAIEQKPDCIGNLIKCDMNGKYESAIASYKYRDWADNVDGFRYVRNIYHMSIVRRDLALKAGFKNMNFGEDYDYCMRLQKELDKVNAKEVFIDKEIYYYQYKPENPKTKYGIK